MTLKAKFAQLASMLQDTEHSLKLNLNSKPNLSEFEALIKKEMATLYDKLKVDINNLVRQEPYVEPSTAAISQGSKKCDT